MVDSRGPGPQPVEMKKSSRGCGSPKGPPSRKQRSCSTRSQRPVQFEITAATRDAVQKWIKQAGLRSKDFLFPSRIHDSPHLGTRQHARILEGWVGELGLDPSDYGTHVQLLLGHSKLESTVRYFGIEVDDALEISEQTEI